MNDEQVNKEVNALTGGSASQPTNSVDWEAKYHELENKFNGARVEEGRVKKLNDELKERDRRIAELESRKTNESLVSSLTEEEREKIPSEVLDAASKLVASGMSRIKADNDERFRQIEQRSLENMEAQKAENGRRFLALIDAKFPGFRSSVGAGGDKANEWASYLRFNKESLDAALKSGDFDTFAYHVDKFYTDHLGVRVPSGDQSGSAVPDPRASGGGNGGGQSAINGKTYTHDEFMALYDALEIARDKGDTAEMARLNAEIKSAPAEGRVK